jgi:type 1 fimbria pilin
MTRRLFVLACAGIMLAAAASAQETINTASVSGRVTDQQGAVVPGAAVARPANADQRHGDRNDGSGGEIPFPLSQARTV